MSHWGIDFRKHLRFDFVRVRVSLPYFVFAVIASCGDLDGPDACDPPMMRGDDGYCYECPEGSALHGPYCVSSTSDPLDDAIGALPPCSISAGDGRLTQQPWCADGGCVGDSLETLGLAWGDNYLCESDFFHSTCVWEGLGLSAQFLDERSHIIMIDNTWGGRTIEGLGTGVSVSCFLDGFTSQAIELGSGDGVPHVKTVWFTEDLAIEASNGGIVVFVWAG